MTFASAVPATLPTRTSYPLSAFLQPLFAQPLVCVACHEVPANPLNNSDGDIFCDKCTQTKEEEMSENVALKKVIMNLKVKCLNGMASGGDDDNEEEEGSSLLSSSSSSSPTNGNSNSAPATPTCLWTGSLSSWPSHSSSSCSLRITCPPI